MSNSSVTRWLRDLRAGDDVAATRLWDFTQKRLLTLARRAGTHRASYDEEDVAQSAFAALCRSLRDGAYEAVGDRFELWQLLTVITLNKARTKARDASRLRRGGGVTHIEIDNDLLQEVVGADADPALAASMRDQCEGLLARLGRDDVRMVALLKVEGYTNEEIAAQLGCTRRSIHRRLALIRKIWANEVT